MPHVAFTAQVRVSEKARAARSVADLVNEESLRNRERVSEILKLHAHNVVQASKVLDDLAEEDVE